MHHNHNNRAYPAGKLIPRRHRIPAAYSAAPMQRWESTTAINRTDKHLHARKSRQWFARHIREETETYERT